MTRTAGLSQLVCPVVPGRGGLGILRVGRRVAGALSRFTPVVAPVARVYSSDYSAEVAAPVARRRVYSWLSVVVHP